MESPDPGAGARRKTEALEEPPLSPRLTLWERLRRLFIARLLAIVKSQVENRARARYLCRAR